MRDPLLILTLVTATVGAAAPTATQDNNFHWSGVVERGKIVEIRGVNGSVRARASGDGLVHVDAASRVRSDAQRVDIRVVEHDRGVTICTIQPRLSEASDLYDCVRGGDRRSTSVLENDPEIDFVVGVPVGARFSASTVNADVEVQGLQSEVNVATISGRVSIQRTGQVSASSAVTTVNGDVVLELPAAAGAEVHASTVGGDLRSDFPVSFVGRSASASQGASPFPPDPPSVPGGTGPLGLSGRIGEGGPAIRILSINGSIRLLRQ
jgi:hypothetical protein